MPRDTRRRRICFVTGTRAEFGLMTSTLRAIQSRADLELQLIATGTHLDPAHGRTITQIRRQCFTVNATVPWPPFDPETNEDGPTHLARATGQATARLAGAFAKLDPDIVLVVGDRVEAFAAATAAHLSGRVLAHVHGGDRALGQVDDALRHAITKLAHLHFPATKQSARRLRRLGEGEWRIHRVGSPGIDGIDTDAWPLDRCTAHLTASTSLGLSADPAPLSTHPYLLYLYHPTEPDDDVEYERMGQLLSAVPGRLPAAMRRVIVYPNNDPGSAGVVRYLDELGSRAARATPEQLSRSAFVRSLPRPAFLGLLRDAAVLIGNSSAGIIEAASFGTPVVDVGPRQAGRERGRNVTSVPFNRSAIRSALRAIWNDGHPKRHPTRNLYGQGDTAQRIAHTLATTPLTADLRRKLIAY